MVLNHPLATAFHTPSFTLCSHFSTPRVACTSWTSTIRSARLSTRPLYTRTRRGRSTCTTSSSGCGGVHTSAEDWVGAPHMQLRSPAWPSLPTPPLLNLLPPCMRLDTLCLPPLSACAIPACLPACPTPQPPAPPSLPPPFLCRWAPGTSFLPACPTLKPPAPSLPSSAGGLPARPTSLRATTTPASTCWRCPPSHKTQCVYRRTAGAVQGTAARRSDAAGGGAE